MHIIVAAHSLLRTLMSLLLALSLCATGAAAADSSQPLEKIRIRAERLPDQGDQRITAVAARTVLRAFLEENPHIELEPFVMPVVSSATAFDSGPLMAIAAGVPPHVLFVNFRRSSTYISQGFLDPLEVLLARVQSENPRVRETDRDGKWLEDPTAQEIQHAVEQIRQRVPEPMWPVVYREDESGRIPGEHVWTINTTNLVMALLYRKDLFNEAGLDPERPPRNWGEFLEYARRLTIPERNQYGLGLFAPSIAWSSYSILSSNGARAVEKDETGEWRAVYGSDEAAEAVRFLWQLTHEPFERNGRIIRGATLLSQARPDLPWDRGELGMIFAYLNEEMMANVKPQLVGIAPVPLSPKGTRASEINGEMLGVYSQSTPQQKLAAMKYIWFITGDEAKRIRTKFYVDNGFGIFVSPDLLERFGYDRVLRQVPKEWKQVFDEAMGHGIPEPYGRNTSPIWRYMAVPINNALELPLGQMTPEQGHAAIKSLLVESAQEVNRKLLGIVPPKEMRFRRVVAFIAMLAVAAAFIGGLGHVWRYFGRMARASGAMPKRGRARLAYLLLVPALGLVIMWSYFPLVGGAGIAVVDYQLAQPSHIVWFDNFAAALFDEKFWAGFARTFYFVALVIGLGFWPPILLAILLQEIPTTTAKYTFRIIFYLPAVISGVIVMFLWRQLYDPSANGILNQLILSVNHLGPVAATMLKWLLLALWLGLVSVLFRLPIKLTELHPGMKIALFSLAALFTAVLMYTIASAGGPGALVGEFHLQPLRWINSPQLAMLCVVIPMVWAASGHASILYLAALKNVPEEMYEAAEIDGATHWHKIFYIVLPRLKFLIVIQFIAAVIGAFKGGTDYILALTGGGPNEATTVLALEIFFRAFLDLQFGIGAAMAWILGALLIGFTAYQLKTLSRAEVKAG